MDNVEKVYEHIKSFMEEHGFPPTTKQIADSLKMVEKEVKSALDELEKAGRLMIEKAKYKVIEVLEG
ncbi:MAG: hypothetical protein HFI37_01915 [Lachnospiraceae bacterium]|jgi:Mn-dependent DtxR family transcriptional regulator|nr:hypothetical protein [Lachnospiraceae bacterium]